MSFATTSLINQLTQGSTTNQETTHQLIQWFDYQAKYNQDNNKDIWDLDIAIEEVEKEVKEVKEDLKRKRLNVEERKQKQEKVDNVIAQLVVVVAVLEGQVEQQRILLLDHTQTLATHAIKRACLAGQQSESVPHTTNRAGPSQIPHTIPPSLHHHHHYNQSPPCQNQ